MKERKKKCGGGGEKKKCGGGVGGGARKFLSTTSSSQPRPPPTLPPIPMSHHDHDQMDEDEYDRPTVAVAIDRDKNSQAAVKWAVDNLLMRNQCVSLVHVRIRSLHNQMEGNSEESEALMQQFFLPFRGYCARKAIITREVVLDDTDIVHALISYINANCITSIVLGAPNRNTFTRKFMKPTDVPSSVTKSAPDFCGVYVISKSRVTTVRSANRPAPSHGAPPRQPTILRASDSSGQEDGNKQMGGHLIQTLVFTPRSPRKKGTGSRLQVLLRLVDCGVWRSRTPFNKGNGSHRGASLERRYLERSNENMKMPPRERPRTPVKGVHTLDNNDFSIRSARSPGHRDPILDEDELSVVPISRSCDLSTEDVGFSFTSEDTSSFLSSQASRDIEAEMRRLRLELKQTMDMYSSACKEALTAKQKALELQKWKMEESRKFEQAKFAEEAALALAKFEKERCIRALESAGMSQKLAEIEAQKRMEVELKFILEAEQRRAFGYTNNDVRYRKYSVEEIEIATDNFSEELKIGEGGYGPVYRTTMDHTPVAIKAMRADTAQGMEQFQKEVEVLSCIRHPYMVLLLGACPENGCLVYEYMDNGSLDDRLFRRGDTPPIPWSIRFKIAAEIATALLFLHQTKPEPLVHRDLKPGNILLDRNYTSKISDVGLARLVPPTVADTVTQYRMTSAAGTFCYIDPEYQQTGMLGIKSDVYSLGIMLLQMITAKPPMGLTHHVERSIEKGTFEQMLDPAVTDWPVQEAMSFAKLALQCAELRRKDRPDLGNVVLPELNRLRQLGMSETLSSSPISYAPWSYNAYSRPRSSHASQETSYSHTTEPPRRSSYEVFSARSSPKILIGRERFVPTRLKDANE